VNQLTDYYGELSKKLPVREFDVVVAGDGTAGGVADLALTPRRKDDIDRGERYPGGTV